MKFNWASSKLSVLNLRSSLIQLAGNSIVAIFGLLAEFDEVANVVQKLALSLDYIVELGLGQVFRLFRKRLLRVGDFTDELVAEDVRQPVLLLEGLHRPDVLEPHEADGHDLDADEAAEDVDPGRPDLAVLVAVVVAVVVDSGYCDQEDNVGKADDVKRSSS